MAELPLQAGISRHERNLYRSKKLSTKVDLTPMVDLGFLLITFFILTTTLTEAKAMRLFLPAGETPGNQVGQSTVLTIIPINNETAFYYHGELSSAIRNNLNGTINLSNNGIRKLIQEKKQALRRTQQFKADDMILIIKPTDESNLKNIVDAFDEVQINDLKHYAFVDLSPDEKKLLRERKLLE
jgi:biopolymer transport protein ExbD